MKVIGVCGLGYTGSGAIVDLLREYDECSMLLKEDLEFSIAYTPDGLEDLEYHLVTAPSRYMSSDVAINRFKKYVESRNTKGSSIKKASGNKFYRLSMDYINSLIQVKWRGYWGFDFNTAGFWKKNVIFRILENRLMKPVKKTLNKRIDCPPVRDMYLSVEPDNFLEITRKYVSSLITSFGFDDADTVVLNQPFSADNPEKSFRFFENPYAIIVDRDPRDLYVLIKKKSILDGSFIPTDKVEDFISYYRLLNRNRNVNNKRILQLHFEDIIYNYDETVAKVESFIGLRKHTSPKQYLKPELSMVNTQLFTRFPELESDVKRIEKELPEFLYTFQRSSSDTFSVDKVF